MNDAAQNLPHERQHQLKSLLMERYGAGTEKSFVLIDDDPLYCSIMSHVASTLGITLDYYTSLLEMGSIGRLASYQLAIVDYDLGPINGVEVAEYLPALLGSMPLVLISAKDRSAPEGTRWPDSVARFVNKGEGTEAILRAGCDILAARSHSAPREALS